MPEKLTITCPHCAFSRTVPKSVIPDGVKKATCPSCKQAFPLNEETVHLTVQQTASSGKAAAFSPPAGSNAGITPPSRMPAPPQPAARPTPRTLNFSFHGSARDYFGIWIVNTLLKIVTLGIYSAWAKVRQRCFFYGSTSLHNQPFEYLADPMALFKGWLIAAGAFILYSIATRVSPILSVVIGIIIFLAWPWLVVRSRIFNAANSSYRNIRFGFSPDYRQAYVVFAGLMILSVLSFGLLAPYMLYRQKKFMVENSSYGATPFTFTATVKEFYMLSLKVALGFLAVFGTIGAVVAMTGGVLSTVSVAGRGALGGLGILSFIGAMLGYFILMVYGQTALANLSWNSTRLGNGSFASTLRTRDMALLFVTNSLAIMFTIGLMIPWATVRLARYRCECLELETRDGLDNVIAAAGIGTTIGATGDEIGDVFGMQVDIAL